MLENDQKKKKKTASKKDDDDHKDYFDLKTQILNRNYFLKDVTSKPLRNLLEQILSPHSSNPEEPQRLTIGQILNHPWVLDTDPFVPLV